MSRNRIDNQIFSNTLKRAAKKKHLDYTFLIEYEKKLNVKTLNTYM